MEIDLKEKQTIASFFMSSHLNLFGKNIKRIVTHDFAINIHRRAIYI